MAADPRSLDRDDETTKAAINALAYRFAEPILAGDEKFKEVLWRMLVQQAKVMDQRHKQLHHQVQN